MRNKGKVHPSPSSSSSSDEPLSVLNLLPAAILTLTCVLSLEDRQVLAYMITRSMKATTNPPQENPKRSVAHKPPLFHCDCFDCYTSFWFRWDSSPNRELIHQAIEAFEEHLNSGEYPKKNRHRKKEKMGRRGMESPPPETPPMVEENKEPPAPEPGKCEGVLPAEDDDVAAPPSATAGRVAAANSHKGFARKVLPDVLGVFNSRLWSLWSPNL
ncbi:PREDICTED: uncharacterized protein LOC109152488 [Ipomoea nil]|uniref:uncharacterized protein LOC109152488 n=1 Tax=Ipomoea nil TaxID=35883 RepID=UPI000900BB6D|nr:PREDICTED: uncharacterized protein LOC109152488 [Ipomoea nil]